MSQISNQFQSLLLDEFVSTFVRRFYQSNTNSELTELFRYLIFIFDKTQVSFLSVYEILKLETLSSINFIYRETKYSCEWIRCPMRHTKRYSSAFHTSQVRLLIKELWRHLIWVAPLWYDNQFFSPCCLTGLCSVVVCVIATVYSASVCTLIPTWKGRTHFYLWINFDQTVMNNNSAQKQLTTEQETLLRQVSFIDFDSRTVLSLCTAGFFSG